MLGDREHRTPAASYRVAVAEQPAENRVVFDVKLHFEAGSIDASVPVPDREMRVADFLPVMQKFQDVVMLGVRKDVERRGQKISCAAGCGACCRQPVPISESEAVALAELVANMPEARRAHVRARFQEARRKLESRGLIEELRTISSVDKTDRMRLGGEYFRLWIACPFLEDENCSIYEDRPLRCREFLVTSPPENCSSEDPGNVERPAPAPGPWPVVYRFEDGKGEDAARWVPLVLAIEFADERTQEPMPTYPAPDMFANLLEQLGTGADRGEFDDGA